MTEKTKRRKGRQGPPILARIVENNEKHIRHIHAAEKQRGNPRSVNIHVKMTPELVNMAKAKAEALGVSFNHFVELAALAYLDHADGIEKGEATE